MDRGKLTAAVAAVVVTLIVLAVGAYLILGSSAPKEDTSWVPTITPYVDDRAGVLSYDDYLDLDDFCYAVERNNSCEIAVLIVNTTQPVGINDYAIKVFEKNGIGQAGKDNGVLFVYSSDEKAWRAVTGRGVADILNGARLTTLSIDYLEPRLQAGNYSGGIKLFIYAIGLELVDNYHSPGHDDYPISFIPITGWQWLLIIAVFIALTVVTKGRTLFWIGWILFALTRGKSGGGSWGGGRTGGGGARGRL